MIAATGVLGKPDEYFRKVLDKKRPGKPDRLAAAQRSGIASQDVGSRIALAKSHGTTPNGICSFKLFATHYQFSTRERDFLDAFPNKRFVRIFRRDLLGQAISFALAKQTKRFRSYERASAVQPVYDRSQIEALMTRIAHEDAAWRCFFAQRGESPLTVCYEDLASQPMPILQEVAGLANLRLTEDLPLQAAKMKAQRNEINRDWKERYIRESDKRGDLVLSAMPRRTIPGRLKLALGW